MVNIKFTYKHFFILLIQFICGININSFAQSSGDLDLSFNPGSGANDWVLTIQQQNDGKIIIGGDFTTYNGSTQNHIVRLNSGGGIDLTYNTGTGADNPIEASLLQADGKIIVVGSFTMFNGVARNRIARLNTDGTLDLTFNPGTGADSFVDAVAIQNDGKIIIGGSFTTYNGIARHGIARLNTNGSIDTTFNPGIGTFGAILTINVQSDGKIIIGGGFTTYNGTPRNRIARLNVDGSLDSTFIVGTGLDNWVYSSALQSDGKIVIVGWFTLYDGTAVNNIARLNADGSIDGSFNIGTGTNNFIRSTSLQSDGKILLGGSFISYNGTPINRIARLNTDGTLDVSFNPGTGANMSIWTTAPQNDGRLLLGGYFDSYNGISRTRVARIYGEDCFIIDSVQQAGAMLTANMSGGTYQWIDCDNSNMPILGETNQSFSANLNGHYAVIITESGCIDTSACYAINSVGLFDENFAGSLKLFPNPTNGVINIFANNSFENATIRITNITGQLIVMRQNFAGITYPVDLQNQPDGVYFLEIADGINVARFKMVKQ